MPETPPTLRSAAARYPVIVAGSGGSGTRLLVSLLRFAGVYMGANVNPTEDALCFHPFNAKWIRPYLASFRGGLSTLDRDQMAQDFQKSLRDHAAAQPRPDCPWGWKRPESIYIFPFLAQQLPEFTFVHVVRSGLDMAFSSNQNDLLRYAEVLFGRRYAHEPLPLRSLRLWLKGNLMAAEFGESRLGSQYLRISYEALCLRPEETIALLFARLGLETDPAAAAALVTDPGSIGRWRSLDDDRLLIRLLRAGEPGLRRFGYWDESVYRERRARAGRLGLARLPLDELGERARHLAAETGEFCARFARAARERRLLAAFRNRLARWGR